MGQWLKCLRYALEKIHRCIIPYPRIQKPSDMFLNVLNRASYCCERELTNKFLSWLGAAGHGAAGTTNGFRTHGTHPADYHSHMAWGASVWHGPEDQVS